MKILIYFVIYSSILFSIFSVFSLYKTIVKARLHEKEFCLTSQCLEFFAKEVSGILLYFQAFGWLMTTFVTIFGVIIALMTYYSGVKSNNNSNYTAHLTMFREFASAELLKRTGIYPERVNLFRWYKVMFPKARSGDFSVSDDYVKVINSIQEVIEEANIYITEASRDYKYKTHQRKMMAVLDKIGVCISNGPKNIFVEIEFQVLEYIDVINLSFCSSIVELSKVQRKYT